MSLSFLFAAPPACTPERTHNLPNRGILNRLHGCTAAQAGDICNRTMPRGDPSAHLQEMPIDQYRSMSSVRPQHPKRNQSCVPSFRCVLRRETTASHAGSAARTSLQREASARCRCLARGSTDRKTHMCWWAAAPSPTRWTHSGQGKNTTINA